MDERQRLDEQVEAGGSERLGLAAHRCSPSWPSTRSCGPLLCFRPNLLFSLTTTAGGDTGAHHYPAQYLIQELLPNFRLTGWAPGWYAGMPMLTFYFPFPFLLIAILDWFIPYEVAFKLDHGAGGLRPAADRVRDGPAVAGAEAVPHHGGRLRAGLPAHGGATPSTAATSSARWQASSDTC